MKLALRKNYSLIELILFVVILSVIILMNFISEQCIFIPKGGYEFAESGYLSFGFPFEYLHDGMPKKKYETVITERLHESFGLTAERKSVTILSYDREFFYAEVKFLPLFGNVAFLCVFFILIPWVLRLTAVGAVPAQAVIDPVAARETVKPPVESDEPKK